MSTPGKYGAPTCANKQTPIGSPAPEQLCELHQCCSLHNAAPLAVAVPSAADAEHTPAPAVAAAWPPPLPWPPVRRGGAQRSTRKPEHAPEHKVT